MQQTNWYTVLFVAVMSVLVALGLTALRQGLKPLQDANELLFNKKQILGAVMDVESSTDVDGIFSEKVKGFVVNSAGEVVSDDTNTALEVDLAKESKKSEEERQLPIYEFTDDGGEKNYIVYTRGGGLWGWISAYVGLGSDKNEIVGIAFDHETETPGLGAEIKDNPNFYNDFKGEKIFNEDGEFVAVTVKKGNGDPPNNDKNDHEIDAISGATITGDGVTEMLKDDIEDYLPYLKNLN